MAADVELHRAVDWRGREIGGLLRRLIHREWRCMHQWGVLKPDGLEVFAKPLPPALTSVTALAVAAETAGGVEKICAVDPNHAGLELRRNMQCNIDALAPHARGPAVK